MADDSRINLWSAARARLLHGALAIDLASSYALSVARVGSMALVVGLLYRHADTSVVGAFLVVRATLALLTYLYAGFNPSVQRAIARASSAMMAIPIATPPTADAATITSSNTLDYQFRSPPPDVLIDNEDRRIVRHANAAVAAVTVPSIILIAAALHYAMSAGPLGSATGDQLLGFEFAFTFGTFLRLIGEPFGGLSQSRGLLRYDNVVQLIGETVWAALALGATTGRTPASGGGYLLLIGITYALSGLFVAAGRSFVATRWIWPWQSRGAWSWSIFGKLFAWSLTLSLGSIADFLYGPSNVLIINRLLSPALVADYGPALQIDGALLLTVSAVAVVLLPRVVEATKHDDLARVRRLYLRSTLASFAVLAAGAVFVIALRDFLLRHWLGTVPPMTRMILPWVLTHTVIGGTAGVGRATLLGLGRFRAYTISAIIGGVANVGLALMFVQLGLGLRGIALATILAVTVRCAIWMPIYILRATNAHGVAR